MKQESNPKQATIRLAELMASLSLAVDLGTGQPMEWVLRACQVGVRLAQLMGKTLDEQRDTYYLALLRHIGCTANSTHDAEMFGNELAVAEFMTADMDNMPELMGLLFRLVGQGQSRLKRIQMIARIMAAGPQGSEPYHNAHCEVAALFAGMFGFREATRTALWQVYERWDGKGTPHHLKGNELALPIRIIHVAQDVSTIGRTLGVEAAIVAARQRAGRLYDPVIVEAFCDQATTLLAEGEMPSVWEAVLATEPGQPIWLTHEQFDEALLALADFTDLKTPYTLGHSRSVATVAAAAAQQYGLPATDVTQIRRASYLHDIGRVGVSAAIWNKTTPLSVSEWEQVRLHPYYTGRIFDRAETLRGVGSLGAMHHERLDGSGYHRGLPGSSLPLLARLLAAANRYCALSETRPHHAALTPDAAAKQLQQEVKTGQLDGEAVQAVLRAAGHHQQTPARPLSTDLSPREIEVLRLIAQGHSNKQMAQMLVIAEKTVGHHIQHIYQKIGVSTRAGATLYAVQNHLLHN